MNNTSSLEKMWRTGNLDSNLLLRQHKIDLMARFMDIISMNPELKKKEIATELGYSSSNLQQHKKDKRMQTAFKSNNPKRPPKSSNDLKRHRITSKKTYYKEKK